MLAGLWFGSGELIVNLFLKPLQAHFQALYEGIQVKIPGSDNPVSVRGILLCGTCDLPARSTFLNTIKFNGAYGCPRCKAKGENVPTSKGSTVHVYPYSDKLQLRSHKEHIKFATEAVENEQPVFGVKGPSVLLNIVPDLIVSTAVDIMHCVYLGVAKRMLQLWFDSSFHKFPFSLSTMVDVVDHHLMNIKVPVPDFMKRKPRSIRHHIHYWKASELKAWLFYYSVRVPSVLSGHMQVEYFNHYQSLVYGIYLLNQASISKNMIKLSSALLKKFVCQYQQLYGIQFMTINVHQLLHLPEVVTQLGPLWTTSCFPFEDLNGKLLKMIHGTRYVELQIHSSMSFFRNIFSMVENLPPTEIQLFCKKLICSSRSLKVAERISDSIFAVGKYVNASPIPRRLVDALLSQNIEGRNIKLFYRLKVNNTLFFSRSYPKDLATLSYYSQYRTENGPAIGIVEYFMRVLRCECLAFCPCAKEFYAFICKTEVHTDFRTENPSSELHYLKRCIPVDDVVAVKVDNLIQDCFCVTIEGTSFVAEPVNRIEVE